ncbi:flavoprotein oxidoreductase [Aeromicrobium sp. Root495]|uniref:FAD-dependent oxidoreductase n=1 Tax=Aeromicrobium sp. Root495 TaxID=1736550 RepID=UPI0006F33A9E|nr:FAD-dependent oxidoreductase [Aeromicrobium sp. Root495]KQY58140.1 flavoprotein oxidoreductase [Aeromicrobium sp. Root495]RYJ06434.1 MAG: flavoprotein oxidoreductase [Actinomycetales bacterium]
MATVVVIGGDAAGMSVAAGLRRQLPEEHEVVVLERGHDVSYSACGIPYWVAGEVDSAEDLVARTPEEHVRHGIDLRLGVEALSLDLEGRTVRTSDGDVAFDHLVLATGAEPVRPDLPGIEAQGILGVQSLDDGRAVLDALADRPRHVVVVGSGYIGLEMAEACTTRGFDTTVVERSEVPLGLIEPQLGEHVADAMRARGIELRTGSAVSEFRVTDGRVSAVVVDGKELSADLVILGLGVGARSRLAQDAGVATGPKGALLVDPHGRVEGHRGLWAAGDCVASVDRTTGERVHVALGTHANKQGMVVAGALAAELLGEEPHWAFPGVVQTAITRFCSLEVSRVGLGRKQAEDAGFDPAVVAIDTTTHAGYLSTARPMTVLMVADRGTRRLLGVQVVGGEGAGLRIDAAAVAITAAMTVDDVVMLDLAYAPPFSSVWSPIQVAARAMAKELGY